MLKRNSADTEDLIDYNVGDITTCLHCKQEIVAIEIKDDWDYDDPSAENPNIIEFKTMHWEHYQPEVGTCAEGKTGAYPDTDLDTYGKAELCPKCNNWKPRCTCVEEIDPPGDQDRD